MKEIILSNIEILKILLKKDVKQEIDPIMLEFEPEVKSDIGITLLGNSITLTPGTVTIFAQKDKFLVHAISPDFKDGIFALQNKVKKIEEAL
ncbi:MAG: multicomponent Na+:H+ antiporter subunit [Deferribacteres bacterium]|nr:cation antiporter [Deferribacteraceae bacterium]MDK2792583.1 multicomponent Na+:H+ antiporter subunit [Deferribacteres bacterium]